MILPPSPFPSQFPLFFLFNIKFPWTSVSCGDSNAWKKTIFLNSTFLCISFYRNYWNWPHVCSNKKKKEEKKKKRKLHQPHPKKAMFNVVSWVYQCRWWKIKTYKGKMHLMIHNCCLFITFKLLTICALFSVARTLQFMLLLSRSCSFDNEKERKAQTKKMLFFQ